MLDSAQCGSLPLFRPHHPCLHRVILRRGGGHLVLCPVKGPADGALASGRAHKTKTSSPTKSLYEEVLLFAVWDVDFSSSHHLGYVLHLPAEFRERRRPSSPREPSGLPRLLSPSLLPPPPLYPLPSLNRAVVHPAINGSSSPSPTCSTLLYQPPRRVVFCARLTSPTIRKLGARRAPMQYPSHSCFYLVLRLPSARPLSVALGSDCTKPSLRSGMRLLFGRRWSWMYQ